MSDSRQFTIDEVAVAHLIEAQERSSIKARFGSSLMVFAVVLIVAVAAPELIGAQPWPGLEPFGSRLVVALAVAVVLAGWTAWRTGNAFAGASVDTVSESIRAEWNRLMVPKWPARVLAGGLAMGIGVGVPVGILVAFGEPIAELPGGSRVVAVLAFVALTWAWTVPLAFGIRLLALRSHRKYIEGREGG